MDDPTQSEGVSISPDPPVSGSQITTQYGNRRMKVYPLNELEIDNLSMLTGEEKFYWAASTFCLGLFAASMWDALGVTGEIPMPQKLYLYATGLGFLASALRAYLLLIKKSKAINELIPDRRPPMIYRALRRLWRWADHRLTGDPPLD